MFEVWDWHIEKIFQLFCNPQELDNAFCLLAEMSVQLERIVSIHLGHFKIVFWPSDQCEKRDTDGFAHQAR